MELSVYHHFGSNLKNLPSLLDPDNFGTDNLTEQQIALLGLLQNYIDRSLGNSRAILRAYSEIAHGKNENYYVNDLVSYLKNFQSQIQEESHIWKLNPNGFTFKTVGLTGNEKCGLSKEFFQHIVGEFVHNALRAYKSEGVETKHRNILISIELIENQIVFKLFNSETLLDEYLFNQIGKKPVAGTISSGTGFYFLNFILSTCKTEEYKSGLHFQFRNCNEPVGFEVEFKMKLI